MIEHVQKTFGRLDILVSNAATGGFRLLIGASARNFEAAMNTNVRAFMFLVQSALPLLERSEGRSKVIALSSHGSHMALPMYGLIGASKAALESLVRHLTLEIGDRGVNLNVVMAGLVETDSTRNIPRAQDLFAARRQKTMTGERMLTAADVADAVLYLASPLSDQVQGATLVVDGGASRSTFDCGSIFCRSDRLPLAVGIGVEGLLPRGQLPFDPAPDRPRENLTLAAG